MSGTDEKSASGLTHVDAAGVARMVDVGTKDATDRVAVASALVTADPDTIRAIRRAEVAKGDVLAIARIAGIMAAKRTSELIPLCHPLRLTSVDLDLSLSDASVQITATARAHDQTGVEMEALTAASVAALTIYDMCKAIDRGMVVEHVQLEHKRGGKSGEWTRPRPERSAVESR